MSNTESNKCYMPVTNLSLTPGINQNACRPGHLELEKKNPITIVLTT